MKDTTLNVALGALLLLLGLFGASLYFINHPVTTSVPVYNNSVQLVYVNNTVEKVVNVSVDSSKLADAVAEYKAYLNDENYLTCDNESYDFSQVSFNSIKDVSTNVDTSNRYDTVTTVSFLSNLKYSDKDVSTKCYKQDNVSVEFHSKSSVDPVVTLV